MRRIEITDKDVLLRPFTLEYAEEHLAGDDEENVKWLSGGVSTIESVQNWILNNQVSWENDGPIYNFAIFDVNEDRLVGMVEANSNPQAIEGMQEGEINISYNIYPFARGKGYATKAVCLLIKYLKERGFHTALICVHPDNRKSLGVPERSEFTRTGLMTTAKGDRLVVFKRELRE